MNKKYKEFLHGNDHKIIRHKIFLHSQKNIELLLNYLILNKVCTFFPFPTSLISYSSSLIIYPSFLITFPYPFPLIPYLLALIPHPLVLIPHPSSGSSLNSSTPRLLESLTPKPLSPSAPQTPKPQNLLTSEPQNLKPLTTLKTSNLKPSKPHPFPLIPYP